MKEYKVGDTIYVKGKIMNIDNTALPYCVDFESGTVWATSDDLIDELPVTEPVKPVLPKDVADELEIAKDYKDSFDVYIMRIINGNPTYENSHVFWSKSGDGVIKTLMDAWDNGYTVETEKKYNLILGTDSRNNRVCVYHIADETRIAGFTIESNLNMSGYQFTQSEIDKYNDDFCIRCIDLNDYKVEVTDDEQ